MIDLTGKVAIVGGAGSGIGEASVRRLASLGAKVVVGDVALANAEKVASAITADGGAAIALFYDLHDEASIRKMIEDTVGWYGRLDILHANAADLSPEVGRGDLQIADMDAAVWDRVLHGNLTGSMLCAKYAIPHMIAAGGGSIVFTGSVLSLRGNLGQSAYSVSKAGLIQLARQIATQYGKQGVRANVVLPGLTTSAYVLENIAPFLLDLMLSETLTPTLAAPEDIADAVAFLASDAARVITAQALAVDGGEGAHFPGIGRLREIAAAGGLHKG